MKFEKTYLGDGVYLRCDGFGLVLTTENGYEVTNRVVLEPHMTKLIQDYYQSCLDIARSARNEIQKDKIYDNKDVKKSNYKPWDW